MCDLLWGQCPYVTAKAAGGQSMSVPNLAWDATNDSTSREPVV